MYIIMHINNVYIQGSVRLMVEQTLWFLLMHMYVGYILSSPK